ncbi:MAG: hypothetical protein K5930_08805 [Treponemataceae bacterium]|nr:hypothetical protein [Treponemataceae bacterium]
MAVIALTFTSCGGAAPEFEGKWQDETGLTWEFKNGGDEAVEPIGILTLDCEYDTDKNEITMTWLGSTYEVYTYEWLNDDKTRLKLTAKSDGTVWNLTKL